MASRGTGSHRGSDKVTSTQPTYACFECTLVLVCGYSPEEIKEIKATVEAGGGKVYTKFAKSSLPQVVVCGSAGDKTYRVGAADLQLHYFCTCTDTVLAHSSSSFHFINACAASLQDFRKQTGRDKVPAVTKQWVEDCNRAKGQVTCVWFNPLQHYGELEPSQAACTMPAACSDPTDNTAALLCNDPQLRHQAAYQTCPPKCAHQTETTPGPQQQQHLAGHCFVHMYG